MVATNAGSTTEIVINSQTGLINELSTNQLVISVVTFVVDSELRTSMSATGR